MTRVLIWLASPDREKLMPGLMWGLNAKRNNWVDEVKVVVFGPSEKTVMDDDVLFSMVQEIEGSMFCRRVAEMENTVEQMETRGANLAYVGEPIAKAIAEGFTVLTF